MCQPVSICEPISNGGEPAGRAERAAIAAPRRFFRAETVLFLGIWLILLIGARSRLFRDPGTLWHPVVGARILSDRECLRTDPFSFTHQGEPWIAQWWLGECALASVYGLAGLDGLLLATATVLAGLYTWVAHRLIRAGVHPLLAVFLTACAMLASSYHFHPRPHLLTIVLMGWTFARLCDWEAGRISTGRLFWLVPLFLLWANVHGGMVGGVAMLAICAVGWTIAEWIRSRSARGTYRQSVMLVTLVIACGLTALINPFGLALPRVWFSLMTSAVLPEVMEEHAPLRYAPEGWAVLLFGLIYMLALIGTLPRRPRVTWLIPLLWLALAWTRVRHGPLFAITAVIALADMLPEVRWARWLARRGSVLFQLRSPEELPGLGWRAALVPAILVMTAASLQLAAVPFPVLGRGWARLDRTLWPVDLLPELRDYARNQPDGAAIFNDMHFGGFLIRYTPRLRVFIDDRCELYGDEGLLAYARAARDDPGQIERWAEEYGFRLALVQSESPFDRYLQGAQGWRLVRRTAAAALFERSVDPNRVNN